jgi:elongation factor G
LVDAIALKLGITDRLGSVDAGSSVADYSNEERNRKITIFAKPFSAACKTQGGGTMGLVLTDTPGYLDFVGQVIAACRVSETALIAVNAVSGVQVGTRRAWRQAGKDGLARAVVVTGLDRENASFEGALAGIQEAFGPNCVPVVLPLPDGSGVVDVLAGKAPPAELADAVQAAKNKLIELAAETNDALIEKFLAGEDLSPEEIGTGLVNAVTGGGLVPVFACMPLKGTGVTELLEGIARLCPSPLRFARQNKDGQAIDPSADAPVVGFVWRSVNDAFVGQLSFVRILGGTLRADSEVQNATKSRKERVGSLLVLNGKKQESVHEATAGDIVALPKLKETGVGDTLCALGQNIQFETMKFPQPVVFLAVRAKTQADEDKLGVALARVAEEDPTMRVTRNTETRETVLAGMGDVHVDVAVERMKSRSNAEVSLDTPKVPYRETVTSRGEGHYKHKKQSGGRGQYGEVYLRVEPKAPGDEEWFVDAVVGGVIPNNFIPAVQKGLVDGMQSGGLAGYPVTDVKVTLYDGSYHEVDSSEIAFKIAGARALKDAMLNAKPVLLEPIMKVRVMVPEQNMGDVNGDLNHRRGRILGMETEGGAQVIVAEVPQAELFRYAAELRSMTGGQGSFEMEFSRYEVVPSNVAQRVIAERQKEKEEE